MSADAALEELRICERNQRAYNEAMQEFQAACLSKNWKAVEQAHAKAVGAIDAFFDNMAAAYKRRG